MNYKVDLMFSDSYFTTCYYNSARDLFYSLSHLSRLARRGNLDFSARVYNAAHGAPAYRVFMRYQRYGLCDCCNIHVRRRWTQERNSAVVII